MTTNSRRRFLLDCGLGLGSMALSELLGATRPPHFAPRAKSVIFLFMEGGPSQIDLFDPKPALAKWSGKPLPPSMTKDLNFAFIQPTAAVMASPRKFEPRGQSGTEISDLLPHTAACADDLCVVRSMWTEAVNHHPGQQLLFTGTTQFGRPAMGAWVLYGLGSESDNLPGFVVLSSGRGTSGGVNNWSSGFLPSTYQGVPFRPTGDPVPYLSTPDGVTQDQQRDSLDLIAKLNRIHGREAGDREIESRIQAYELAFRMQMSAPELLDFSREPKSILEMYGVDKEPTRAFAVNCLLARRMVERGVRFVMPMHASWDDHSSINQNLVKNCGITDQPIAALLRDLKQRGLLDTTLVVWGGEFGRTPMVQMRDPKDIETAGRDHHPLGYTMWLAGGGVKRGAVVGATDELGLNAVKDRVHVHDLQATILHCLGIDHLKLTHRHMGRDFRLTDVAGRVVPEILL